MIEKNNTSINISDTLFGDLSLDYWSDVQSNELPWNLFKDAKQYLDNGDREAAIDVLTKVTALPVLESRHYLQAWYFLSHLGVMPEGGMKIYGVVVEVGMPEGVDLLAIYADHSARYYNYSGRSIVWESSDESMEEKIDVVLEQSLDLVQHIGPWKDKRRPAPQDSMARLNFLTSHGLHFGEASQSILFKDPKAGKIMYGMLDIMNFLISKTS
jgi:hypothetical protein